MSEHPAWLPILLTYSGRPEDWPEYEVKLYQEFDRSFVSNWPELWGRKVKPIGGVRHGRNAGFWHMLSRKVSDDYRECARDADLERCERLAWARPVIEAANEQIQERVVWWENERSNSRGTARRTVIATVDFSYLVVLDNRADHYVIWTQYPIAKQYEREKKRKECMNYWRDKKAGGAR